MIKTIEERLKGCKLTAKEALVLEYFMKHQRTACFQSAEETAHCLNVSPATVVRLSARLGFDTFTAFKKQLQTQLVCQGQPSPAEEIPYEKLQNYGLLSDRELLSAMRGNIEANIKTDQDSGQNEKFICAADLISQAKRVYIVGFRACYGIASTFATMLSCIRSGVCLVGGQQPVVDALIDAGPGDVAVVISFKRYSRDAVFAAELAADAGCPVAAVTDSPVSPIAAGARVSLMNHVETFTFYNSYASAMMNLELVAALVSRRSKAENRERLVRMENYLERTSQY